MQQKPQKQHRQLMISKCSARECRDPARHHVKRRWLLKIKTGLQNQVNICNTIKGISNVYMIVNGVLFLHDEKYYKSNSIIDFWTDAKCSHLYLFDLYIFI